MQFDPTVTLGNLFAIGSIVGSILIFALTIRSDVKSLTNRVDKLDTEMAKQTTILVTLGVQESRLDNYDQRIAELQRRLDSQTFFIPTAQPKASA